MDVNLKPIMFLIPMILVWFVDYCVTLYLQTAARFIKLLVAPPKRLPSTLSGLTDSQELFKI
jgi:hypothetical protein